MSNRMRRIVILFIACSFLSCSGTRNLTLYVTNIKETEKSVHLKIYVNDSLCVNDNFKYSTITPNYYAYKYKFDKGIHTLKIFKDGSQLLTDTFTLKKNMFIYISYGEGSQGEGRIFVKKTTVNYKLH
jgi:hypothetical protein